MPKSWLSIFVVLGLALACTVAYAQVPTIPSSALYRDGTQNTNNPYDSFSYPNIGHAQFVPPGEFCVNPPNSFGAPTPGSGLLEPAQFGGLGFYCDGRLSGVFGNVSRNRGNDAFHTLTDLQRNGNTLWFQNQLNYNATTTFFPGGFGLSCPMPMSTIRINGMDPQPITSVGPGFIYLGTLTGCCGSCPAPSQGGLYVTFQATSNAGGSGALLLGDYEFLYATVGIHYNSIRLWAVGGGGTGFMSWIGFFQGVVYALEGGGCKTYGDLKDEILNATITGNPPSDPPFDSVEGGPWYKHDSGIGGIRNALWKKAINSEAAFERGQLNSAGNTLGALTNHVEAQDGKHLDTDSASDLKNCVRSLRGTLGI
jgi:hypothetical protein